MRLPGLRDAASWTALFAPAHTPDAITERLNKLVGEITTTGKVAETYHNLGLATPVLSRAEMRSFFVQERKRWAEAVRVSGAKVD